MNQNNKNDLKYLKHLAKLGTTNIHPGGINATEILIQKLEIKDTDQILEIGCGTGETMVKIASVYPVRIDGVDVLPEMANAAIKRVKFTRLTSKLHIYKLLSDSPLPFENQKFDKVYTESALCFHDEKTVRFMLNEIYRLLKKGGLYVANEAIWKDDVSLDLIKSITDNAEQDFGLSPASKDILYLKDWKQVFSECGFELNSWDDIGSLKTNSKKALNFRIILSKIFTNYYRAMTIFRPSLIKEYFQYKQVMKKHKQDKPVLEARIFVLRKV